MLTAFREYFIVIDFVSRSFIMKKLAKIVSLILVAVMCIVLASCGATPKTVDDIKSSGKLVIATSPDFPPFESIENNEVVGIEIDILQLIADKLGVELVIEQMDFDSVLHGIQSGKYDIGVSGITITETRQKNADFTNPYFMAAQVIVVKEDSEITCKADLEGKKISVQTGTTAEEYCISNGYDVSAFQSNNDACSALTDKVDAWVVDNEVAIAMTAEVEGLVVLDEYMTEEPYGFALLKGSDELVAELNKYIDAWIEDGTIAAIFEKYDTAYVAPTK